VVAYLKVPSRHSYGKMEGTKTAGSGRDSNREPTPTPTPAIVITAINFHSVPNASDTKLTLLDHSCI